MLIYVKIIKKLKFFFVIYVNFMLIYVNITDRQMDGQTHQKYSSEPHKIIWIKKSLDDKYSRTLLIRTNREFQEFCPD